MSMDKESVDIARGKGSIRYCTECGAKVPNSLKVCPACGESRA
ncbi:MAG: hypothetical protein ACREAZ_05640 [Nitrososphaera sp.]